ncbi:MAG: VOC family protein [Desmonostoc geniculatum HA4340-LM1]|jgi:catechol 2,3-dioxygenase-like lactoylglutathione lyase family enzyme|nr:VOC family protein [Desmonostoc geniculatum HA4340-LM1]
MSRIADIAYVTYKHSNLDECERFLTDFGMIRSARTDKALYMRGRGKLHHIYVVELGEQPEFVGFALQASSQEALEEIANLPKASAMEEMTSPGGGYRVTLIDPNGFRVDVVYGIEEVPELSIPEPLQWNYANIKQRYGRTQRPVKEPTPILRLGHIGIDVKNFEESYQWYQKTFGLTATDVIYYGHPSLQVGGFLRCKRGEEWVDHHTIALLQGSHIRVHHTAFEVQDFDAIKVGHDWLKEKGWIPAWGIGRHLLGSQVFDYWQDPFGSLIEHFTDGDLFNESTESQMHPGSLDILYQWGPPIPEAFLG